MPLMAILVPSLKQADPPSPVRAELVGSEAGQRPTTALFLALPQKGRAALRQAQGERVFEKQRR
jgi:hypothetical protein